MVACPAATCCTSFFIVERCNRSPSFWEGTHPPPPPLITVESGTPFTLPDAASRVDLQKAHFELMSGSTRTKETEREEREREKSNKGSPGGVKGPFLQPPASGLGRTAP